jgi:hypothetical protein
MESSKAITLLSGILKEITDSSGIAAVDNFYGLRAVDAKVKEAKMILSGVNGLPDSLVKDMDVDENFNANSRRVRLETLSEYIKSALKFLNAGGVTKPKKQVYPPPDVSKLTATMPYLKESISRRWIEAQKCQYTECYTSAIIMMGSILEALLLSRANMSPADAYQSNKAPKGREGKALAIQDWTLNSLVDVAVDLSWIKSDRGKFSHALRESRNVVHPWVEVTTKANFDEATCKTSWEVLKASVDDLLKSL